MSSPTGPLEFKLDDANDEAARILPKAADETSTSLLEQHRSPDTFAADDDDYEEIPRHSDRSRRSWLMTAKFFPDYSPATPKRRSTTLRPKATMNKTGGCDDATLNHQQDGSGRSGDRERDHDTVSDIDITSDFDSYGNTRRVQSMMMSHDHQAAAMRQKSQTSFLSDLSPSNNDSATNIVGPNIQIVTAHGTPKQRSQKSVLSDLSDPEVLRDDSPKRRRKRRPTKNDTSSSGHQDAPTMPLRRPTLVNKPTLFPLFGNAHSRSLNQILQQPRKDSNDGQPEREHASAQSPVGDSPWVSRHSESTATAPRMPSRRSTKGSFADDWQDAGDIEDPSVADTTNQNKDTAASEASRLLPVGLHESVLESQREEEHQQLKIDVAAPRMPKRRSTLIQLISKRFLRPADDHRLPDDAILMSYQRDDQRQTAAPKLPRRRSSVVQVLARPFRRAATNDTETKSAPVMPRRRSSLIQKITRPFQKSGEDIPPAKRTLLGHQKINDAPRMPRRRSSVLEIMSRRFQQRTSGGVSSRALNAQEIPRDLGPKIPSRRSTTEIAIALSTMEIDDPSESFHVNNNLSTSAPDKDEQNDLTSLSHSKSRRRRPSWLRITWPLRILPSREAGGFFYRRASTKDKAKDEGEVLAMATAGTVQPKKERRAVETATTGNLQRNDEPEHIETMATLVGATLDTLIESSSELSRSLAGLTSSVSLTDTCRDQGKSGREQDDAACQIDPVPASLEADTTAGLNGRTKLKQTIKCNSGSQQSRSEAEGESLCLRYDATKMPTRRNTLKEAVSIMDLRGPPAKDSTDSCFATSHHEQQIPEEEKIEEVSGDTEVNVAGNRESDADVERKNDHMLSRRIGGSYHTKALASSTATKEATVEIVPTNNRDKQWHGNCSSRKSKSGSLSSTTPTRRNALFKVISRRREKKIVEASVKGEVENDNGQPLSHQLSTRPFEKLKRNNTFRQIFGFSQREVEDPISI